MISSVPHEVTVACHCVEQLNKRKSALFWKKSIKWLRNWGHSPCGTANGGKVSKRKTFDRCLDRPIWLENWLWRKIKKPKSKQAFGQRSSEKHVVDGYYFTSSLLLGQFRQLYGCLLCCIWSCYLELIFNECVDNAQDKRIYYHLSCNVIYRTWMKQCFFAHQHKGWSQRCIAKWRCIDKHSKLCAMRIKLDQRIGT